MKWFFAVTEETLAHHDHDFPNLIKTAVASSRANTTLLPNLIYHGKENALTAELRDMGVNIIHHQLTLAPYIREHAPPDYPVAISCGAFLRTDIPDLEHEDDFIIYTDCDVIFLGEPTAVDLRPSLFACAPEFSQHDYTNINTGVMVMNLPALRQSLPDFRHFILQGFPNLVAYDQGAYQSYYSGQHEPLPATSNWKPYWGVNPSAEIIHFHGPKPFAVRKRMDDPSYPIPDVWSGLMERDPAGYREYLALWERFQRYGDKLLADAAS